VVLPGLALVDIGKDAGPFAVFLGNYSFAAGLDLGETSGVGAGLYVKVGNVDEHGEGSLGKSGLRVAALLGASDREESADEEER
jgi:hypothetical protein